MLNWDHDVIRNTGDVVIVGGDPVEKLDPAQRTTTTLAAAREIAAPLSERAAPQPMMA